MSESAAKIEISVVIPLFNEQASLRELVRQIQQAVSPLAGNTEIIFVDDGSTDGSWDEIEEIASAVSNVVGIRFRRNFGKAAALQAGFARTRGRRIITMDADLQDDPAEIPRLLAKLDQGFDLVSGWKQIRHDPWHKVLPSRVFNTMVSRWTGVRLHDINCGLKAYRSEVIKEIQLYGEFHRFTPILAAARGFRIGEIPVHHRPREFGHSKYRWTRFLAGFIDLVTVKFLTSYQHRPQHMIGTVGLGAMAIGALGMSYLAVIWILTQLGAGFPPIGQRPLLVFSATAVLVGMQMFSLGLIGELIAFRMQRGESIYSIAEEIGSAQPPEGDRVPTDRR
ncbi:glycosyltransferase family 2 protein [bacterium]|nr:glycosyltransferase family 2 protein [bacterium]